MKNILIPWLEKPRSNGIYTKEDSDGEKNTFKDVQEESIAPCKDES